jgi:chromate reductase
MNNRSIRILGLAGSLRGDSWNRRLLQAAALLTPPGTSLEVYDALASVPLFDEDLELTLPGGSPGVRALRAAVAEADGLMVATPEYNQAMPGVLKNALDWLSRDDNVLQGLPVAVLGATVGAWGTRLAQASLRQVLHTSGSLVMPSPMLFVANAHRCLDPQTVDQALQPALQAFVAAFAAWVRSLAPIKSL